MQSKIQYFAKDLLEEGKSFVLARILETDGSAPRKEGAWMIMTEEFEFMGTVGGGKIEAVTQEYCREHMKMKGPAKEYHFKLNTKDEDALDMGCGGTAKVSVEYISDTNPGDFLGELWEAPIAYIFGGGHVGLALEPVLRHIDFKTVVIDDREEYANKERFPESQVHVVPEFENCFKSLNMVDDAYIIIVTRGHRGDYTVLKQALKKKRDYLGMIGSRKKNAMLFAQLKAEEKFSQEEIDKVYAPIGEPIYAETPEEIAISIAAEIIRVRTGHGIR